MTRGSDMSRRDVLAGSVGGFLGFAMANQARVYGAPAPGRLLPRPRAKARSCIVLWMGGGPSQFETFSPKERVETSGPTKTLETTVKGLRFAENMPNCARQAHLFTVVRSMKSREASHDRATYLMHTGYSPSGRVVHPSIGSVLAMELDRKLDLPNYIAIAASNGNSTLGSGAGFLPSQHNPFVLGGQPKKKGAKAEEQGFLEQADLSYPEGVDRRRFRSRMKFLAKLEERFGKAHAGPEVHRHRVAYDASDRLMHTPLLKAFDLSGESEKLRKAYGETPFGKGCLLARRLVETGVPFIEVRLGGWDTHRDNFKKTAGLCRSLDPAMATLLGDLNNRGMLEETLVVWMGEFGRTPKINGNTGRDHYPRAWTAAFAGGGVAGGRLIGATDETGREVTDRPVTAPDFFATVQALMGVDHTKKIKSPQGPVPVTQDGEPVKELLG